MERRCPVTERGSTAPLMVTVPGCLTERFRASAGALAAVGAADLVVAGGADSVEAGDAARASGRMDGKRRVHLKPEVVSIQRR